MILVNATHRADRAVSRTSTGQGTIVCVLPVDSAVLVDASIHRLTSAPVAMSSRRDCDVVTRRVPLVKSAATTMCGPHPSAIRAGDTASRMCSGARIAYVTRDRAAVLHDASTRALTGVSVVPL